MAPNNPTPIIRFSRSPMQIHGAHTPRRIGHHIVAKRRTTKIPSRQEDRTELLQPPEKAIRGPVIWITKLNDHKTLAEHAILQV
jgi:hypothetical protein